LQQKTLKSAAVTIMEKRDMAVYEKKIEHLRSYRLFIYLK